MKFYLSGQRTFANRGCEAIVRSTVQLIRDRQPTASFVVPSDNIQRDADYWPEAGDHGVTFVPAYNPRRARFWAHFQRLPVPAVKAAAWPFPAPVSLRTELEKVDAVIAIGGDNYSLDYRIPGLVQGIDAHAMKLGKPVYLWGASVGPFEAEPRYKATMVRHLSKMQKIFVREPVSFDYLTANLSLPNVVMRADPAFTLRPEAFDLAHFWPNGGNRVIGINMSPLVAKKEFSQGPEAVKKLLATLVRHALELGNDVILIPHVAGNGSNDDYQFMAEGLNIGEFSGRVTIAPPDLNAAQLKYVISKLSFFIGARTHATIAAFSSGIPTISLSYSVKAKGINQLLFGHTNFAMSVRDLSIDALLQAMSEIERDREETLRTLSRSVASMKTLAGQMADELLVDIAQSEIR